MNPIAIVVAMALWMPYNGGQPPCAPSPRIEIVPQAQIDALVGEPGHSGVAFHGPGRCDMLLAEDVPSWPLAAQCALVAHELGHAFFGLRHSDDPASVMFGVRLVIPAMCRVRPAGVRAQPRSSWPSPTLVRDARRHRHPRRDHRRAL